MGAVRPYFLRSARSSATSLRRLSSAPEKTETEKVMHAKLVAALEPLNCEVNDVSGGCGSFYNIFVESPKFAGLTTIKQHRLVTEALKVEIKEAHGVTINTKKP